MAQSESATSQITGMSSSASLAIVYGWYHNPKNDKWITKANEIKDIDRFKSYSIFSFRNNAKNYVAIVKEYEEKDLSVFNIYILDYNNYVEQLTLWDENTTLKFPILKQTEVKLKKKTPLTNELLGLDDLSDITLHPQDYFVYQYKFFADNTVKFLFFVESCSAESCVLEGLNFKKENIIAELYKYTGNDNLYNEFFYKTTHEYFIRFTDSPIKK